MSAKTLYRIGGISAIAGGIITQASGALHPVETATIFDPAVHMREIADNPTWTLVFFGFSVGFLLILTGLGTIARAIEAKDEPAAAWAVVARTLAVATTAVALVFFIVDGFAAKTIALSVVASGNDPAMVAAAGMVDRIGRMFFGMWTFLAWGVTPLVFGVAVLRSTTFKRWLGLLPMVSGIMGIAVGTLHDLHDFSLGLLPPFYMAVLGFNVWMVVMGASLLRRAGTAEVPSQSPVRGMRQVEA